MRWRLRTSTLRGTELVVLSACDTALGQIDYGEGVSGLVRALRTAGARNVLVTLRPVDDAGAERFMERFYFYWFKQPRSDPAAALLASSKDRLFLIRPVHGAGGLDLDTFVLPTEKIILRIEADYTSCP
jgi:CHAT domain-containing protein